MGAIAAIQQKEDAETNAEKEAVKIAREQQQFLLLFAQACFANVAIQLNFQGLWQFDDSIEVTISQDKEQLLMKWTRAEGESHKDFEIRAHIQNRALFITDYKWNNPYFPSKVADKGYAYLSVDEQRLMLMILNGYTHSFLTLTKI